MAKAVLTEKQSQLPLLFKNTINKKISTLLEELENYNRTNPKIEEISKVKNNNQKKNCRNDK